MHDRSAVEVETDILIGLSPDQKFAIANGLRRTAWELAAAGVRLREPALSEDDVQARVRDQFLRASS
jgi:hypothetical protein